MTMHIELIEDQQSLAPLEHDWNAVYEADPDSQLFLSWKWLSAWLTLQYGPWLVLAAKSEHRTDAPYVAFFPVRILVKISDEGRLHNELNMVGNFGADYTGLICLPQYEQRVIPAFARAIKRMNWASLGLNYIRMSDARSRLFLSHFPKSGFVTEEVARIDAIDRTNACICPFAPLPDDWEAYLAGLSTNTRQKFRRLLKLLDEGTDYRITEATAETFDRDLDRLLQFWESKWKPRKGERIHELVRANRSMLRVSFRTGLLKLPTLWHQDRPVVALANFVDPQKRTMLFYMTGRDEAFEGPSTGLMLHAFCIRQCISNGFVEYDFMRGNEPYKYSFGVQERHIRCIRVATRSGTNLGRKLDIKTIPDALEQATAMHRDGRLVEAERAYRQILDSEPKQFDTMHRLGQLLISKGDHANARMLFKKLTGLRGDLAKPWLCLAQCCEALRHDAEAAEAYREVARIQPDHQEAFVGMARLLVRMGRLEDVNTALRNALAGAITIESSSGSTRKGWVTMQ
jgi:CelD/BcsL family acetyltransferase involved in cellulose biosynthesis